MSRKSQLQLATDHLAAGRFERAVQCALAHLVDHPDCAESYEILALGCVQLAQWPQAAAAAARALQLDPQRRECYRALARALVELGRPEEATATLLGGIAQLPEDGLLALDAALILRDGGLEGQALELLDKAVDRCASGRWELEHLRLELLMATGNFSVAADAARQILERLPDDISALDRLSAACYGAGDLSGAIAAAEQVLARTPGMLENELRLAGLLREDGQLFRAVALFEHVAEAAANDEQRHTAATALRLLDDAQIPLLLHLAEDSRTARRELRADPAGATARRGFALSQTGLARLAAALNQAAGSTPVH